MGQGRGRSSELGGFFANADSNYLGREIIARNENVGSPSFADVDSMDMSDGMQEAMHRSNLEMRYKHENSTSRCLIICIACLTKKIQKISLDNCLLFIVVQSMSGKKYLYM